MRRLLRDLVSLRERMLDVESAVLRAFPGVHRSYLRSACNLAHYTALRSCEVRGCQERLARRGLSSLGRSEGNALANLDAVIRLVAAAAGATPPAIRGGRRAVPILGGRGILQRHTADLLGPPRPGRAERIMVTLPSEAADDAALVRGLAEAGMDCARVNCAHDDAAAWERMIRNVRAAARSTRRRVRVVMDLAGPKLRTGPLAPGPDVVRVRPKRDALGRVVEPARVWLAPADSEERTPPGAVRLPVPRDWLARRRNGDVVTLLDARGSVRTLQVVASAGRGRTALCSQSAYVVGGTRLAAAPRTAGEFADVGQVVRLPATEQPIELRPGDELLLTRSLDPGAPAQRDGSGRAIVPARVGCTLPQAVAAVRAGDSVWLDDGKLGGVVVAAGADEVRVRIDHAAQGGTRLRADKGINLPDTAIDVSAITEKDAEDLPFVVRHADAVSLSFVRRREDVADLERRLAALRRPEFGIVLKIETRQGFENLPELLLAAMASPRVGVMIARGDLAVECGWERLAEIQEEILWFCEAAHVPVVWATQVLDGMARTGQPTRAEVTDAAMSGRAECVMLNKGPYIREAVHSLDGILRRMEGHQRKKSPLLRRLRVAGRFVDGRAACGRTTDRAAVSRPARS